jgi:hypothetical protein
MSLASRQRELARRLSNPPRNPTSSERRRGAPPLKPEEWERLRAWQVAQRAALCGPWLPWPDGELIPIPTPDLYPDPL